MTQDQLNHYLAEIPNLRAENAAINFGVPERDTFRTELLMLTDCVLAEPVPTDAQELESYKRMVRLVHEWNTMLKDANAYRLSPEMSYCIEKLISDWDPDAKHKIVVFTLGGFAVHKLRKHKTFRLVQELLYITQKYHIRLSKEPVFVMVPDAFKDDMLSNIVLFHEIGHFVDKENALSQYIIEDVLNEIGTNTKARIIRDNFPFLFDKPMDKVLVTKMFNHIEEYLADVFGSVYAGRHILNLIPYVDKKHPKEDDDEHPSYACRLNFVNEFVSYSKTGRTKNRLLNYLLSAVKGVTSRELRIMQPAFTPDDHLRGNLQIGNIQQMLAMYIAPWDIIIKERDQSLLPQNSYADYRSLMAHPVYVLLDNNVKTAIANYKAANP